MGEKSLTSMLRGEKAFVPYIMAGDGGLEVLMERLEFLQEQGASAVELGIPFSDPVADGPTIQAAGQRALDLGVNLSKILSELLLNKERINVPIILMTYYNPILQYGIEGFREACCQIGIAGLIIPDLPLEESELIREIFQDTEVCIIQLVSLTSPPERIKAITSACEGFVYAVTINGITGARESFIEELEQHFREIKQASDIPVLAGFGISTPEHVQEMNKIADGVVIGSAIVEAFHRGDKAFIKELIHAKKTPLVIEL